MKELTDSQQKTLDAIVNYMVRTAGVPPTRRELQDILNVGSSNTVTYNLYALAQKGYITIEDREARGIRVIGGRWTYTPLVNGDE